MKKRAGFQISSDLDRRLKKQQESSRIGPSVLNGCVSLVFISQNCAAFEGIHFMAVFVALAQHR